MAIDSSYRADGWIWSENADREDAERPFEFSLIRSAGNVRAALLILVLVAGIATPLLVTNRVTAYTGIIIGVLLTLWTRYIADWLGLRRGGQLGLGAVVVVMLDYAWLCLLVVGTGGITSPLKALLMVPMLFAVGIFARMRFAVAMVTGMVVIAYIGLALRDGITTAGLWQLGGTLLTVMALAWVAHGICLVLERERRANELVIRYMSDAVLLVDSTMRVGLCNRHMERLTGIPPTEIVGRSVADIVSDDGAANLSVILTDVRLTGDATSPVTRELEMNVNGAETLDLQISTVPCATSNGEPLGWVVICNDVTPVKSLIRLKEKGISMLSHEIRSPLTTLRVAASMLSALAEKVNDEDNARFTEVIQAETERLIRMAGDFLNASALDGPDVVLDKQLADVGALVKKTARMVQLRAGGKNITVDVRIHDDLPDMMVDAGQLMDALQRLCDNAIKYTESGGQILISAFREGDQACISVSDSGQGIPTDKCSDIFEKFAQLDDDATRDKSERGAGLGLYVVKRTAELHGGSVEVVSEPGQGSMFTLRLPILPVLGAVEDSDHQPIMAEVAMTGG